MKLYRGRLVDLVELGVLVVLVGLSLVQTGELYAEDACGFRKPEVLQDAMSTVQSGLASEVGGVSQECEVRDEWLNRDYDTDVDYANPDIPTDFFILVYSNSPDFCRLMEKKHRLDEVPFQCDSPNTFGWVIHGLWAESRDAYVSGQIRKHPRFCKGNLPALPLDALKPYLCMSPGTSLLQGEWEKHGACDFATARDYFSKGLELYYSFARPPAELNAKKAVAWMKKNNPTLSDKWLDLSGHEFGICFSKQFEVMSCPVKQVK